MKPPQPTPLNEDAECSLNTDTIHKSLDNIHRLRAVSSTCHSPTILIPPIKSSIINGSM